MCDKAKSEIRQLLCYRKGEKHGEQDAGSRGKHAKGGTIAAVEILTFYYRLVIGEELCYTCR